MTIEQLQQGHELQSEIQSVQSQLRQIMSMIDESKGRGKVKTRVKGMEFEISKKGLKTEVMKRKTELETQLATLQTQFDAL